MVNQPKHTPGPWQWEGQSISLLNAERRLILAARLHQWRREGLKADKEDVANAALIAAAPDLYAGSDQDRIDLEALRREVAGGGFTSSLLANIDTILVSIEGRLARARGEG